MCNAYEQQVSHAQYRKAIEALELATPSSETKADVVQADEIRNRKNRPDRRERLKDIDLANIRYWFEEFKLLAVEHPNELRLDTTKSKPDETAKKIVAHARRLARRSDTKLSVRSRFKA